MALQKSTCGIPTTSSETRRLQSNFHNSDSQYMRIALFDASSQFLHGSLPRFFCSITPNLRTSVQSTVERSCRGSRYRIRIYRGPRQTTARSAQSTSASLHNPTRSCMWDYISPSSTSGEVPITHRPDILGIRVYRFSSTALLASSSRRASMVARIKIKGTLPLSSYPPNRATGKYSEMFVPTCR